jgi:anti-anti-sigma factor
VLAMVQDTYPVQWTGNQAVVTLPEHIDASNSGLVRELLLSLINRGAAVLVVDMTATVSCDHGGADALARVYQRATVSGTRLRVVVTTPIVRRILETAGLDRLISIYPSVEAAHAAGTPGNAVTPVAKAPGDGVVADHLAQVPRQPPAITPAILWGLVDALDDGVLLANDDGRLVLVNRRGEEMFGYRRGELIGRPVESLIPADLRAAHLSERVGYQQQPTVKQMAARARLVGLRKDASTFPVQVSLSPVPTATGHFVMAVIRDITDSRPRADLGDLAHAATAAGQGDRGRELLDRVVGSLYHVGLSLQHAIELPHDAARERIAEALRRLDDTIRDIRDHVLASREDDLP